MKWKELLEKITPRKLHDGRGGFYIPKLPKSETCQFPACDQPTRDLHHVTYVPRMVMSLCEQHHIEITGINVNAQERGALWGDVWLSNEKRLAIMEQWIEGKLKPHWNERALWYTWGMINFAPAKLEAEND